MYGPKYRDELLNKLRGAAELCDSLQSFFVLHSMGGGTGARVHSEANCVTQR